MTARLGIFAINLERSPDRWAKVSRGFSALGWPFERIEAIDAHDLQATLAYREQTLALPPHALGWGVKRLRAFSLVEEACFCSHLKALRRFLETECTHALVLEDDAEPAADLGPLLPRIIAHAGGRAIVKLSGSTSSGSRFALVEATFGRYSLVRSLRPSSSAAAYIVSRPAAEALLERAGKLLVPYDDYISAPSFHGCEVLHVSPWPVKCQGMPSTMSSLRNTVSGVKKRDPYSWWVQARRRLYIRLVQGGSAIRWSPASLFRLRRMNW